MLWSSELRAVIEEWTKYMPQVFPSLPSVPQGRLSLPRALLLLLWILAFRVLFWLVVNVPVFLPDSEVLQDKACLPRLCIRDAQHAVRTG